MHFWYGWNSRSAISAQSTFADIGTDHAYLPVLLLQQCKIEKAVAGDVVPGPCEAARKTVHSFGFTGKLDVRLGSGLTGQGALGSARCLPSAAWGRGPWSRFWTSPPRWQRSSHIGLSDSSP